MSNAPWYSGDPSVNLEVEAKLAALVPADIGAATATDSIDAKTASYVLVAADAAKIVTLANASGNTLTVPPNSSVAFPIGTHIDIIQLGAGQTTLVAGAGVTVGKSAATLKLVGQYACVRLRKLAINTWAASGDLAAS